MSAIVLQGAEASAFSREFNSLTGSIDRDLASGGGMSEEQIHDFRLAVKYLRAVLDLFESMSRRRDGIEALRGMLSPPFDAAGGIRTAQMNLKILGDPGAAGNEAVGRALAADEARSREEFASLAASFDREGFRRRASGVGVLVSGIENARATVNAGKFLLGRYRNVMRILKRVRTARDLHEIRKNIKSARYTLRLIASCGVVKRSGIEEKIVRTIDQVLGDWHDETVFRRRVREIAGESSPVGSTPGSMPGRRAAGGDASSDTAARLGILARDTKRRMAALRRLGCLSRI